MFRVSHHSGYPARYHTPGECGDEYLSNSCGMFTYTSAMLVGRYLDIFYILYN